MTNFEYYVKSGKANEGWCVFLNVASDYKGERTIDKYNNWLLDKHKEPILDDVEREYLSSVIKPFRDRVSSITKVKDIKFGSDSKVYYIDFQIDNGNDFCFLPSFEPSTGMYKNMEANREYTLKELNL